MTIVTYAHRYKRPPRRRKPNPAALAMPAIVRAKPVASVAADRRQDLESPETAQVSADRLKKPQAVEVAPASSAIVTIRSRKAATIIPPGLLPDTPEEHQRRGEAAAAMWREMVRRVAEGS
jgi:hypothetical protein